MPVQMVNTNGYKTDFNRKAKCDNSENDQNFGELPKLVQLDWPKQPPASKKIKLGVFLSTLAGVGIAMGTVLKGKGYSLNPKRIFKVNPKNWGLFHIKYSKEAGNHDIEMLVTKLAFGSVGGGLLGGLLLDKKENRKAKYRESIIQLIGNIFTPLALVALGTRGYEKFEPQIIKLLHLTGKSSKIKKIPQVIVSAASLVGAIFLGNKIGNAINQKLFKVDEKRKLKISDMSPHLDDICFATSLIAKDIDIVPRFIPLALLVAGNSIGTAQECPRRIAKEKEELAFKRSQIKSQV